MSSHHVIRELLEAEGRTGLRGARTRLARLEQDEQTAALIQQLAKAASPRAFNRLATALARLGSPPAVEALVTRAHSERRWVGLAVGAVARCAREEAIPCLIDLLGHGRVRQRRFAARWLGRLGPPEAIVPLCELVRERRRSAGDDALAALRRMGGCAKLARKSLSHAGFTTWQRLAVLDALQSTNIQLMPFRAEAFLVRESRARFSPSRSAAEETLRAWRDRGRLLRPSESRDNGRLLRPAGGPSGDPGTLLRAAEIGDGNPPERAPRGGLLRLLRSALCRFRTGVAEELSD